MESGFKVRRAPSFTEQAYAYLLDEIVSGRLPQGERIVERTVAAKLGLSKTPVREALARLEREALVTIRPQRGAEVRRLSRAEGQNVMELRAELSGYAARRATLNARPEDSISLREIFSRLELAAKSGNRELYHARDLLMHHFIEELAGNQLLMELLTQMRNQIRLVLAATMQGPGRLSSSLEEHRAVVEAIARGDADAAGEALRRHVLTAWEDMNRCWADEAEPEDYE